MTRDKRMAEKAEARGSGHRRRIWQRILERGAESLVDYEMLEVCLFAAHPRRDTRLLARKLIERFGSVHKLVKSSPEEIMRWGGVGEATAALILVLGQMAILLAKEKIQDRHVIANWKSLLEFCRVRLSHKDREECLMIFLNGNKEVIAEEIHQVGSVGHTSLYPREITKRALEKAASFVIIAHNHPDGNSNPSKEDLRSTHLLAEALRSVDIRLHDHVIIAETGHFSFRSNRLL